MFAETVRQGTAQDELRAVAKLTERVAGQLRSAVHRCWLPLRELFESGRRSGRGRYLRPAPDGRQSRRGPALPVRDLRVRGHGAQGRRRRQRRHARVDLPSSAVTGRTRSCCRRRRHQASVLEPLPRRQRVPEPRRAGRPGPADRTRRAIHLSSAGSEAKGLDGDEPDFYVRQLWDWKASIDLATMSESGLRAYARRLRVVAGPGSRPLGRPAGDRGLPRARPPLRRAIARFSAAYAD